jgi:Domain of unknown function (DUF4922)
LLPQKLFATVNADSPPGTAANLSISLLDKQMNTWSQLADGYRALGSVELREVKCNGFSIMLQYNPGRIVSTGARVDDKSIRERKCFLCPEYLPEAQKAIEYRKDFLILCNPKPIFKTHFTVSSADHAPQALEPHVETLLLLAEDFGPEFAVFYNGPECGASAPDHMHFQITTSGSIPVERDVMDESRRIRRKSVESASYFSMCNYGRRVLVVESPTKDGMAVSIAKLLDAMKRVLPTSREPKINLLSTNQRGLWKSIVFPRRKHRPDIYFREGQERVVVSPALVDMGGLVIAPIRRDFERIDAKMLEGILDEVSISDRELEGIFEAL